MKKMIKESKFLLSLCIMFFAYISFLQPHYSSDSYANTEIIDTYIHLNNGRIVTWFIQNIVNIFGVNLVEYQFVTTSFLIIVLSCCICSLYLELKKYIFNLPQETDLLVFFALHIVFVNVFFAEWFLYVESLLTTMIGLSLTFQAVILASRKKYVISLFILLITQNMYQLYIVFFITLTLILVFIKNNGQLTRKSFTESVYVVIDGAVAVVGNLMLVNLMKTIGVIGANDRELVLDLAALKNNLQSILSSQENIWLYTDGLLPANILLVFLIVIVVTIVANNLLDLRKNIYFILLIICGLGITFSPHLVTTTVWLAPRTISGVFILISIVLLIAALYASKKQHKYLLFLTCLFLVINIYHINGIAVNNIINNKLDANVACQINEIIKQYEHDTGKHVENIGIVKDANPSWSYREVSYVTHDMNIKGLVVPWGGVNLINYICDEQYTPVDIPEDVFSTYVKEKNWVCLDLDEQLIIIEDTAYLIMY